MPIQFCVDSRAQKADGEEDGEGPGEEVEGVVLQHGAEGDAEGKADEEGKNLGSAAASELTRDQPGEDE